MYYLQKKKYAREIFVSITKDLNSAIATNVLRQYECLHHKFDMKGTGHDFCWSGKPIYHPQKQGHMHIFQIKYQSPQKFAEIMKKSGVFGKF